ncbi:MAG: helix-turn-helix transcriptional regulator [Clostridia bacterium]|nr:helix-turn-helix transcriptional regulator [Clostridia bacterium]
MKLDLAENIRRLRRRDKRTQEQLAEVLGVTAQAVSRWEAGGSYPDMTLIPSIANFFGVSIDELFGYESDREQRIDALAKEIDGMNAQNNGRDECMAECIAKAHAALVEFPGNEKLMLALASALFNAGYVRYGECHVTDSEGYSVYDTAKHRTYAEWSEAEVLYEKMIQTLPYGKLRDRAMGELSQLYLNLGETEKGSALAASAPSMHCSKEFLLTRVHDGKQGVKAGSEMLMNLVRDCGQFVISITTGDQQHLTAKEKAENIAAAIRLFEAVCPDGNYGVYHAFIVPLEMLRSLYLWLDERREEAFAALNSARENSLKFIAVCEKGEARYTAPLVRLLKQETPCDAEAARWEYRSMPKDWPWFDVPEAEQVRKEIQADPRWTAWVESIK